MDGAIKLDCILKISLEFMLRFTKFDKCHHLSMVSGCNESIFADLRYLTCFLEFPYLYFLSRGFERLPEYYAVY
jgi:hypothetical protein